MYNLLQKLKDCIIKFVFMQKGKALVNLLEIFAFSNNMVHTRQIYTYKVFNLIVWHLVLTQQ